MPGAFSLRQLVEGLPVLKVAGNLDLRPSAVCYDSRLTTPDSLFVALRGGYADGHDFLAQARLRGATQAVVETWSDQLSAFEAVVQVADSRAALAPIAARFYEHPADDLGVIGVTGTDGKTTTSYLIEELLRQAGYRTGLIGTVSVRVGDQVVDHDTRQTTPESLEIQQLLNDMRNSSVDWAVMEATSHGLAMHRLDDCPFDIGVVTNITHEHLDFHGSVENYRRAKAMLLEAVDHSAGRRWPRGVVLNRDDEGARSIASRAGDAPILWFSVEDERAEVRADRIRFSSSGTEFRLRTPAGDALVTLQLVGAFNVENALAAAAAGHVLGLDPECIATGLGALSGVPGRLHRIDQGQPFAVYVDYAHTPDSLEKMLRLIRTLVAGRIITVFGSAGERDRAKRGRQGAVAARLASFSVFTSEDPRFEDPVRIIEEIAAGAEAEGACKGRDYLTIEDRRTAIQSAFAAARPGDAVLLAGKGHEGCMIYGAERRPWNEAAEARAALGRLGFGSNGHADGTTPHG